MSMRRKEVQAAFLIVAFSIGVAFVFNHLSPSGISLFGQWNNQAGAVSALPKYLPPDRVLEIDQPFRVKEIVDKKERIILDVRHRDFFDMGHIPGALSFPLQNIDSDRDRLLKTVNKNHPVMVYCSGFDCDASHTFATHLMRLAYTDIVIFTGGYGQWQEMGFEIEKNEE
jgi:rhodanese-related sulfurtransferase